MPIYPPTPTALVNMDATAVARATALVTPVTTLFAAYLAAHPEVDGGPAVDIAYVYYGAVTVGLNRWRAPALWAASYPFGPPGDVPTVASFEPVAGTGVTAVTITLSAADFSRVSTIIDALEGFPGLYSVIGQAVCTGLAILSGVDALQGPFHL